MAIEKGSAHCISWSLYIPKHYACSLEIRSPLGGTQSPVKRTEHIPSGSMERIHCRGWEGGRPSEAMREQQELAALCWRAGGSKGEGGGSCESRQAATGWPEPKLGPRREQLSESSENRRESARGTPQCGAGRRRDALPLSHPHPCPSASPSAFHWPHWPEEEGAPPGTCTLQESTARHRAKQGVSGIGIKVSRNSLRPQ